MIIYLNFLIFWYFIIVDNPIKPEHLQKLRNELDFCDSLEDKIAMEKILENRRRKILI